MKSLNDPFTVEKSSDHVTINKSLVPLVVSSYS